MVMLCVELICPLTILVREEEEVPLFNEAVDVRELVVSLQAIVVNGDRNGKGLVLPDLIRSQLNFYFLVLRDGP